MWVQHDQLGVGILPLDDLSDENLVSLYHSIHHGGKGSLVLISANRENDVDTGHEMMPWDLGHVCETQQLELFLVVTRVLHFDTISILIFITSLSVSIFFISGGSIPTRLIFQDTLLLRWNGHQLLPVVESLNGLRGFDRLLIGVVHLGRTPIDLNQPLLGAGRFLSDTALLLQGRENFLSSAGENLHCKFQVLGKVQVPAELRSG